MLEAIYAAFAEGWSDPAGTDSRRRNLADEAIWLGRLVASLLPEQPEALGLLALMLHAESRRAARRDASGAYVPLTDQDMTLWDAERSRKPKLFVARRHDGHARALSVGGSRAVAHAARRVTGRTDWAAILVLYDALLARTDSPVVAINRAIAIAEVHGPDAALAALELTDRRNHTC